MFGLENQKKSKKVETFIFDLEKELMNSAASKKLNQKMQERCQKIRDLLRSGDSQGDFDKGGVLLYGYTACLKVFSRLNPKA